MHHGGGSGDGPECKVEMMWNWHTIDACFLSESWHITTHGAFAASCIGVCLLTVCLELVRRLGKEYDALLLRQFHARAAELAALAARPKSPVGCCDNPAPAPTTAQAQAMIPGAPMMFRASPLEQLIRAVLHAVFFGLAYIIMLLAMYYNGYIIISIVIGAGIGKFLCDWLVYKVNLDAGGTKATGVEEPTVCCG